MTSYNLRPHRLLTAAGVLIALVALPGCQGHKVVARVQGEAINEEDYNLRLRHVSQIDFGRLQPPNSPPVKLDAGGVALVIMIQDRLLEKLATEKKVLPSDAEIASTLQYIRDKNIQNIQAKLKSGAISLEEYKRAFRAQMIQVGLGTNGDRVEDKDLQDLFKTRAAELAIPEMWTIRFVPANSETAAIETLGRLKASGDFKGEAQKIQAPPGTGEEIVVNADDPRLPAPLKDALKSLKDGQFANAPVVIPAQPAAPGQPPPQTSYLIVQLLKKAAARAATFDEVKLLLRQQKLSETHQQWQQHATEVVNDYNRAANIEVSIEEYKPLVATFVTPPPAPKTDTQPMPSIAPGGPPPGGNMSPPPSSAPPTGSTAAPGPSTGNTMAPAPSGSPSSRPSSAPPAGKPVAPPAGKPPVTKP